MKGEEILKNRLQNLPITHDNPNPVMRVSTDGVVIYCNPAADSLLKILDKSGANSLPQDWKSIIKDCCNDNSKRQSEVKVELLTYSVFLVPHPDEGYINIFCHDITAYRHSQEKLKESDERYRLLAEYSGDIISRHDLNGNFLYVSPASQVLLSYNPEELLGKSLLDFIHAEDKEYIKTFFPITGPESLTYRLKCKDGKFVWIESRFEKFYNEKYSQEEIVSISRDVTERVNQELLIREEEKRVRHILEASNEGIIFHANGDILDLNDRAEILLGHDRAQIIGKSIFDFFPVNEQKAVFEKLMKNETRSYRSFIKVRSGVLPVEISGKGHIYKGKEVRVAIITDISEKLKLEEELIKHQALMNTVLDILPINIYIKDRRGRYVFINKYALKWHNLKQEDVLNKTYQEIFSDSYSENVKKGDEEAWSLGQYFSEDKIVKNGIEKYFIVGKIVFSFDAVQSPLLLGYAVDITERKLIENKLKRAKKQSEESIKAKERFISIMSHEIRTPMNAVVGITNLLIDQVKDKEQKEYFSALKISSENLLKILNNVLELSKIDSGKIVFEDIDFNICADLRKLKELFAFKAAEKNIKVNIIKDTQLPEVVKGDPHRLNQILVNLLSNALKFTDEGEINIEARLIDEDDKRVHVLFSVADTGVGIAEANLEKIFDSFTQADTDVTRKYGGTGLGLTITKKLIELQGGRIAVESQPGKGTKFMFDLFFNKSIIKIEPYPEPEYLSDFSNLRVLVVEDNPMNQLVVSKFLERKRVHPVIADNGKQAIEILRNQEFDLVLMDLQMPEMDGFQTSLYIREELKNHKLPIIALTASSSSDIERKVLKAGMNDYIVKPFEPGYFYSTIGKHTGLIYQDMKNNNESLNNKSCYTDLRYLNDASGGNQTFVREMVQIFLRQTPDTLDKLNNLAKEMLWEDFRKLIHKMKPTVSMMGIKEGEILIKDIEAIVKSQKDLDEVVPKLQSLKQICEISYKELEKVLEK